jgi:hypothetical protein
VQGGAPHAAVVPIVREGDEIFAADPAAITEVSLVGPEWRFEAHRWTSADPFVVTFSSRVPRQVRVCEAGPPFDAVVRMLTTVRVRQVLSSAEADRLRATLRSQPLRFTIAGDGAVDPAQYDLYLEDSPRQRVLAFATDLPGPVEIDWDAGRLRALSGGCDLVAPHDKGNR